MATIRSCLLFCLIAGLSGFANTYQHCQSCGPDGRGDFIYGGGGGGWIDSGFDGYGPGLGSIQRGVSSMLRSILNGLNFVRHMNEGFSNSVNGGFVRDNGRTIYLRSADGSPTRFLYTRNFGDGQSGYSGGGGYSQGGGGGGYSWSNGGGGAVGGGGSVVYSDTNGGFTVYDKNQPGDVIITQTYHEPPVVQRGGGGIIQGQGGFQGQRELPASGGSVGGFVAGDRRGYVATNGRAAEVMVQ